MKQFLTFVFLILEFSVFAQKSTETIQIKTSAKCDDCKERIEKALAYEKGVKSSNLEVKTAIVSVTFNPEKTNVEKIKSAISNVGYDADEIKAREKAYQALPSCCQKGH